MIKTYSLGSSAIVGLFVFTLILSCVPNAKLLDNVNQNASTQEISYPSKTSSSPLSVTEHRITSSELTALKNTLGTYQEDVNYSHTINGYSAGVKPPTAAEWTEIAQSAYIVDNIAYANAALSIDNSKSQYFPPIGNQGNQSSCVAWSIGYYMATYLAAKEHGWNLAGATMNGMELSTNYQSNVMSPAFVYSLINSGEDTGASFDGAINLVCGIGVSSWKNMPYNQADYSSWPSQTAWAEAPLYRGNSSGYQYMSLNNDQGITNLKNLLASGNLASINVDSGKFSGLTTNDAWTLDNYVSPQTGHAGTVVGYDDNFSYIEGGTAKQGAFKIANSWGVGFYGEKIPDGYYWISYEAMKQSIHWCCYFFYQPNYQPDLLATFNVNDQVRGACTVTVGLGTPSSPIATKCFNNYVMAGSRPFPLTNIVMDVSEFKTVMPSLINQPFFLKAYESGSQTGTVNYFSVGNDTASGLPASILNYPAATYVNVTINKILPTPTPTPTAIPTPTPTPSPTATPTPSPTPTTTPAPTPSVTPVPTPSPTQTPTPTLNPTPTPTPLTSPTPQPTITPTPTTSPTPTTAPPTPTPPPTQPSTAPTETPTNQPTPTDTAAPSIQPNQNQADQQKLNTTGARIKHANNHCHINRDCAFLFSHKI